MNKIDINSNTFNLKDHILEDNRSIYEFCNKNGISQSKVQYWISKDWLMLNYSTREKIIKIL